MLFGKFKEKIYWVLAVLLVIQVLFMIWMVLRHYESFKQQMTPYIKESIQACLPKKQIKPYLSNHYLFLKNLHRKYLNRIQNKDFIEVYYKESYSDLETCLEQLFLLPISRKKI